MAPQNVPVYFMGCYVCYHFFARPPYDKLYLCERRTRRARGSDVMVLPLGDDNSDRLTTPYVNYTLIAINVFVFVVLQGFGNNDRFTYAFSTVPREILTGEDIEPPKKDIQVPTGQVVTVPGLVKVTDAPGFVYLTLITSMFMHGGVGHILGNMLFLWIFGDNVEDAVGHGRYLVFYLICGVF